MRLPIFIFFFFNDTATTEIYTLSLHDALPIYRLDGRRRKRRHAADAGRQRFHRQVIHHRDRKSTRLNSSHSQISYAVFCLKKKKNFMHSRSRVSLIAGSSAAVVAQSLRDTSMI